MDYKKIFKDKSKRVRFLNLLKFIPDKPMVKAQYLLHTGHVLRLRDAKRYTEKLQWYKLFYRDPLMCQCSDKYSVRDYIISKGHAEILNDLYGVYDSVEDVDCSKLPDKFVLKTTNGSGTNIFCKDKTNFDFNSAKDKLSYWLKFHGQSLGREWAYKNSSPKIIAEKYLGDDLIDYKFICFNGNVEVIVVDMNRFTNHVRNFYNREWERLEVRSDKPNFKSHMDKPKFLDEMILIVSELSKDFPTVRVDMYYVCDKIYFGELTFYPWSGYVNFSPDSFDFDLGRNFVLPDKYVLEGS